MASRQNLQVANVLRVQSRMVRVVLFDLGGLLIEISGVDMFRSWVGDRFSVEDIWHRWLTSPAVRAFEMGQTPPDLFADQLIDEFSLPVARDQFLAAFAAWPRGTCPGAEDLVRRVDRRCVRAMFSNSNSLHWPRVLEEFGLGGLFEYHFASHLMGKVKPDRHAFEHVIAELGCDSSDILFLDDQPLNVGAAREVGIDAIVARSVAEAEQVLAERGLLAASSSSAGP
jgi:putative hydrolase of the HAD superfamily